MKSSGRDGKVGTVTKGSKIRSPLLISPAYTTIRSGKDTCRKSSGGPIIFAL